MPAEFLEEAEFLDLFARGGAQLLDVRSEAEFERAAVPGACNVPILNNQERAQVGLCYKQRGQAEAIELGQKLVSKEIRQQRVSAWKAFLEETAQPLVYCARGGLRSEIAQDWLRTAGISARRVRGGYKKLRSFLIDVLAQEALRKQFLVLSGRTGSGKTTLLQLLSKRATAVIDLEHLAQHRGSAFGGLGLRQPTQANFENALAALLLRLHRQRVLIEDESRMIGGLCVPPALFAEMQQAPIVVIECHLEQRITNIVNEYVVSVLEHLEQRAATLQPAEASETQIDAPEGLLKDPLGALELLLKTCVMKIQKKLGSERATRLCVAITQAITAQRNQGSLDAHRAWIEPLLTEYYDPLYDYHTAKNTHRVVLRGSFDELHSQLSAFDSSLPCLRIS